MRVEAEPVTPKRAAEFLAASKGNRNLNESHIKKLMHDLQNNLYCDPGNPFRLDTEGTFIDGHHRCHAVIRSGIALPEKALIIYDVPLKAVKHIDTQYRRSLGQVLAWEGHQNTSEMASIARLVITWNTGYLNSTNKYSHKNQSDAETYDFIMNNLNEIVAAATFSKKFYKKILPISKSVLGAFYFKTREAGAPDEDITYFFDSMAQSACGGKGDPRTALINRLRYFVDHKLLRREPADMISLLVRTWNSWRKDEEVHRISLTRTNSGSSYVLPDIEP